MSEASEYSEHSKSSKITECPEASECSEAISPPITEEGGETNRFRHPLIVGSISLLAE